MEGASWDIPLLFQLWQDTSLSVEEIARQLGCSACYARTLAQKHHLGKRPRAAGGHKTRGVADPTPEEIAERAAECRAKHLAEKRESIYHPGDDRSVFPASYSWRGTHFVTGTAW